MTQHEILEADLLGDAIPGGEHAEQSTKHHVEERGEHGRDSVTTAGWAPAVPRIMVRTGTIEVLSTDGKLCPSVMVNPGAGQGRFGSCRRLDLGRAGAQRRRQNDRGAHPHDAHGARQWLGTGGRSRRGPRRRRCTAQNRRHRSDATSTTHSPAARTWSWSASSAACGARGAAPGDGAARAVRAH